MVVQPIYRFVSHWSDCCNAHCLKQNRTPGVCLSTRNEVIFCISGMFSAVSMIDINCIAYL